MVCIDPALATTVNVPIQLSREGGAGPLAEIELENFLSQSVGKIFNQYRDEASGRLGVDDLDVVLARSRTGRFGVDGHRVANPLGFRAKRIDAVLEFIFTTRGTLEVVKQAFPGSGRIFLTETGRADLFVIERLDQPPFASIRLGMNGSRFAAMPQHSQYRPITTGILSWRLDSFFLVLKEALGVSDAVANEIYRSYSDGRLAPRTAQHMKKLLEPVFQALLLELDAAKFKGNLYLQSPISLPFRLPHRRRNFVLCEMPMEAILEKFGFRTAHSRDPRRTFAWLNPFLECYADRSDTPMNRWLRRYLQWLGSPA